MENPMEYLLEKLGQALYTHAKEAVEAEAAAEAVDYLDSKGVFAPSQQ